MAIGSTRNAGFVLTIARIVARGLVQIVRKGFSLERSIRADCLSPSSNLLHEYATPPTSRFTLRTWFLSTRVLEFRSSIEHDSSRESAASGMKHELLEDPQPMNLADELQKLQQLHESGALDDEEFSLAKAKLLNDPWQLHGQGVLLRAIAGDSDVAGTRDAPMGFLAALIASRRFRATDRRPDHPDRRSGR